tara:strand:- start:206 stop:490 length:285 start_codon:yes stop_codon:yes gene_type:complete
MAQYRGGLRKWFREGWVDISRKKKDGSHPACGRSSAKKGGKYPKCVPKAKAAKMTAAQKISAVKRKQASGKPVGGKPSRVATFKRKTRRKKSAK